MDGRDLAPDHSRPWQNDVAGHRVLPESAPEPPATFPPKAAAAAVLALILGAMASIFVGGFAYLAFGEAQAPSILAGSVALYGVVGFVVARSSRRWGSGDLRRDTGLRFRLGDLGWGPLTWLGAFGAAVVIGMIIGPFEELQGSNTDVLAEDPTVATIVVMSLVAVLFAPLFEELLFRGLMLRALASAVPAPLAVLIQATAFGLVHLQPDEGLGNVGIVVTLGAVGGVFGFVAYRAGRLGPAIVGHAIFNAVATVATLVTNS